MKRKMKMKMKNSLALAVALAIPALVRAEAVNFSSIDLGATNSFLKYEAGAGDVFGTNMPAVECFASDSYDASVRLRGKTALNAFSITDGVCQRAFWPFVPMNDQDYILPYIPYEILIHDWTVTQRTVRASHRILGRYLYVPIWVQQYFATQSPFSDIMEIDLFTVPTYMWSSTRYPFSDMDCHDEIYPPMDYYDPWTEIAWNRVCPYMRTLKPGVGFYLNDRRTLEFDDLPIAQGLKDTYLSEPRWEGGTKEDVRTERFATVMDGTKKDWTFEAVQHGTTNVDDRTEWKRGYNVDCGLISDESVTLRLMRGPLAAVEAGVAYHDRTVYAAQPPELAYTQHVQTVSQTWKGTPINLPKIKFKLQSGNLVPAEAWPSGDIRYSGALYDETYEHEYQTYTRRNPVQTYRLCDFDWSHRTDDNTGAEWFFDVTATNLQNEITANFPAVTNGTVHVASVSCERGLKMTAYDLDDPQTVKTLPFSLDITDTSGVGEMEPDLTTYVTRWYTSKWTLRPTAEQYTASVMGSDSDSAATYPCGWAMSNIVKSAKLHAIWSYAEIYGQNLTGESKDSLPWPRPDGTVGAWAYGGPVVTTYASTNGYGAAWLAAWDALRTAEGDAAAEACGNNAFTNECCIPLPSDLSRYAQFTIGDLLSFWTATKTRGYKLEIMDGQITRHLEDGHESWGTGVPTYFGYIIAYPILDDPATSELADLEDLLKIDDYSSDGRMGGAQCIDWQFKSLR